MIQAQRLVSVCAGPDKELAERLFGEVEKKASGYANGDLDHAMDTIVLLWKLPREGSYSPINPSSDKTDNVRPPMLFSSKY